LPRNVRIPATDTILTGEPVGSAQTGVGAAEGDEKTGVAEESLVARDQIPVEPVPVGVVAVGIVVAPLRASHLVAHVEHGDALADHEKSHGILRATQAQGVDVGIGGQTFCAAIPRPIIVAAVDVALAVFQIVFCFVGEEVGQGEAVVAGDEIDRGRGFPSACLVKIG